ncbi:MAG: (deoxy)nucleoside triphosphate pyrophosphohydrolase [Bdellovibrionales bacterium]|nr:(deoxy)nucleoside triphosphate pyrophosphohydrolase [Bdellovibrionales bacterium]
MIDVVSGIIEDREGRVLLAERPPGKRLAGFWEFPGGKIEPAESAEAALKRELREELELDIRLERHLGVFPYTYDWGAIRLHVFVVTALNTPQPTRDVQVFRWIEPRDIDHAVLAAADIEPLVQYIQQQSGPSKR